MKFDQEPTIMIGEMVIGDIEPTIMVSKMCSMMRPMVAAVAVHLMIIMIMIMMILLMNVLYYIFDECVHYISIYDFMISLVHILSSLFLNGPRSILFRQVL